MNLASRNVVIYGVGGLGREMLWAVSHPDSIIMDAEGKSFRPIVRGFLDDEICKHGAIVGNTKILGGKEWLQNNAETFAIVAIGNPAIRSRVVESLRLQHATFATFVSPQSVVGDFSQVGEGSILLPGAVVTTNVKLGKFVLLNPTATISHDCVVDDYTSLGPGVSLAGNVQIGTCCDIGTNASVIPGRRIGPNTNVGAGACVTKDFCGNSTVVGVPARRIGSTGLEIKLTDRNLT